MAVLSVTLWGVAWVDIQSYIAFYNVRHSYEVTGQGVPLDQYYLFDLGPAAIPAIDELLRTGVHAGQSELTDFSLQREELADRVVRRDGDGKTVEVFEQSWHGWTWRQERLETYLLAQPFAPDAVDAIE